MSNWKSGVLSITKTYLRLHKMGAKSTVDITRAEALCFIFGHLENADNKTIAAVLDK